MDDMNDNMNYEELAIQMMQNIGNLWKGKRQKRINESMQGEKFALKYLLHRNLLRQCETLPNEISREMGTSSARTAATLNSLERKGYIERAINRNDRRQILVSLTNQGRDHAQRHYDEHLAMMTEVLRELGKDDAQEFVRLIEKVEKIFNR